MVIQSFPMICEIKIGEPNKYLSFQQARIFDQKQVKIQEIIYTTSKVAYEIRIECK